MSEIVVFADFSYIFAVNVFIRILVGPTQQAYKAEIMLLKIKSTNFYFESL